MVEEVLGGICNHAIRLIDGEVKDLERRICVLKNMRKEWDHFKQNPLSNPKPKRSRKRKQLYDNVDLVLGHSDLYQHASFCKCEVRLDDFIVRIGKTIQFNLYTVCQWNNEFHVTEVEGKYVVAEVSGYRVLLQHADPNISTSSNVTKNGDTKRTRQVCPDLELCYLDTKLNSVCMPIFDAEGKRCGRYEFTGFHQTMICIGIQD